MLDKRFRLNLDGRPNPKCVVQGDKYRFTVLTSQMLRMEYDENGEFEDRPTQVVWNRNFDCPEFTVRDQEHCLEIEQSLGRVRLEYHGARTMDIDILLCEGFSSDTPQLTVPHPHIRERAFVLVPLSDLFPLHSAFGYAFHEAYEAVDKSGVALYK